LRVERFLGVLGKTDEAFVLVGSSMGGYVSLVAAEQVSAQGVFLLAPALYIEGYQQQNYHPRGYVEVVHGWSDDVIPVDNSIRFANAVDCSLHLISGDHRLNSSIDVVEPLFSQFLVSVDPH
jgi:pimeloyl-ACP methyl ester carboxylesterase